MRTDTPSPSAPVGGLAVIARHGFACGLRNASARGWPPRWRGSHRRAPGGVTIGLGLIAFGLPDDSLGHLRSAQFHSFTVDLPQGT